MIDDTREAILQALRKIEEEHDVRVLYAAESGSRAWGFSSEDSDYDVRFIFRRPSKDYLGVHPPRDVIEQKDIRILNLDMAGWDIKKAIGLFGSCNPSLLEWLHSSIQYCDTRDFGFALRSQVPHIFSPKHMAYHYHHMAAGNYRQYLKGDLVRLKKYFYVLRPVLACLWIEKNGSLPPLNFDELLQAAGPRLPAAVCAEVLTLLEKKRGSQEISEGSRIDILNQFLENEMTRIQALLDQNAFQDVLKEKRSIALDNLDDLCRSVLMSRMDRQPAAHRSGLDDTAKTWPSWPFADHEFRTGM